MKQEKLSILYFILKGRTLKSGEAPILLRVTVGGDYDEARIQRSVLLKLRITKDRKRKYINLGVSLNPIHWNFDKNQPKPTCSNKDYIEKIFLA